MKRVAIKTKSITVKLSPEEWQLLKDAAASVWHDAPITQASIVSGLALRHAKELLAAKDVSQRKTTKKA